MPPRLTPFQRQCRELTERDFQRALVAAARSIGFMVAHHYDSRFSDPGTAGVPDLTIVHPEAHVFFMVELKREGEDLKPEQIEWRYALEEAGVAHFTWMPSAWEWVMSHLEAFAQQSIDPKLREFPKPRKKRKVSSTRRSPAPAAAS